jgi:hypothetical protein
MVRRYNYLLAGITVVALTVPLAGQEGLNEDLSPPISNSVTIGGKKLRVVYRAPSMRGRRIFGGLVLYGVLWGPGANYATTLTTTADLDIGGLRVPKGTYSLWAVPWFREWTLIFNKEWGQSHTEYHEGRDLGRVTLEVKSLPSPVERLNIELAQNGPSSGTLSIIWEKTEAWTSFTVLP